MATFTMVWTGHSVSLLMFRSSFFFRCLISDVAWPIVTRLCHFVRWSPRFMKFCQTFAIPPEIWRPKNMKFQRDFGQLRDLITNIYGN